MVHRPGKRCSAASTSWPTRSRSPSGPRAATSCSKRSFGSPTVTKDGVTVAKEIELEDKFENMGAQMVKEVASKTSRRRRRRHHHRDRSGRRPSTAKAQKLVAAGANPMALEARHRQGRRAVVVDELKKMSKTDQEQERDRPGRHHLGQQRRDDRQASSPRPWTRSAKRASSRSKRPRAWRPPSRSSKACSSTAGYLSPVLRHRSREDGSRPRRALHPDQREEDQHHEGPGARSGAGRPERAGRC